MKTCQNCGHTMDDQDLFCGNCGAMSLDGVDQPEQAAEPAPAAEAAPAVEPAAVSAPEPVPAEPVKPAGGKGLWKLGIIVAAAVVVLVVAVVGITGALKNGNKSFADVQREFLLDAGVTYVEQLVEQYDAMTNLSTDVTITVEPPTEESAAYLEDTALTMGVETSRDSFALDANFRLMGSDVIGGVVALDDGMLTLALPEISDTRYVLDLKQMIYEATGIEVTELALPELSEDTMTALLKTYFDIVISAANDENVTVTKNQAIELPWLGETVNGTLYVFKPTAKDVEEMLLKLADALENDEELREFILSLTGDNLALVEAAMGVEDLDAVLQDGLDEAAQALRENAAYAGQGMENAGVTWTVGYADGRVCFQNFALEEDPGVGITYESLGNEKDGRQDVFYVMNYGDTPDVLLEAEYTKVDGCYSGTLNMSQYGEEVLSMQFKDVDEDTRSALGAAYGTYTMTVNDYGTVMTMDMNVAESEDGGTDHTIAVSGDELAYSAGFDKLVIHIHSSDENATIELPEGDEVDISSLTDSDLEALGTLIQQHLMETLGPVIMGMDGMYY